MAIYRKLGCTFLLAVVLAGCGMAARNSARENMQQSLAIYKACLAAHQQDVSACHAAQLAYEADLKAYNAMRPGVNDTLNVNASP